MDLEQSIDLLSNCRSQISDLGVGLVSASWRSNDLFSQSNVFEDDSWSAFFSGDLVDFSSVPWDTVLSGVRRGRYEGLDQLIGVFSIAVLDKVRRKLVLITDPNGQAPLYLSRAAATVTFSTSIATFCRMTIPPSVNRQWLYEYMYFNYAVGSTSILQGVSRIAAATAVEIDIDTLSVATSQFGGADKFSDSSKHWTRRSRIQETVDVFRSRIPEYFVADRQQAVSLTSGFDSRTVLAFAPRSLDSRLETYTYGVPGCGDLEAASDTAQRLGLTHHKIPFDKQFLDGLGQTIEDAVFLSGGLERINRSTLVHVYRTLTQEGSRFPVVVTGISGDLLFRDHLMGITNVPSLIPADMMSTIQSGVFCIDEALYRRAFGDGFVEFRDYIHAVVESLNDRYGDLSTPVAFMRFLVFELGPRYFVGETAISSHFTAMRSPYWDSHLQHLAFDLDFSTLGFSKSHPKSQDYFTSYVLQAAAIAKGRVRPIKEINDMPIWAYSANNKAVYYAARAVLRGPGKLRKIFSRSKQAPLENWSTWFDSTLRGKFRELLGGENRVSEYIAPPFIEEVLNGNDVMLQQRLVTSELILRLVANRWQPLQK